MSKHTEVAIAFSIFGCIAIQSADYTGENAEFLPSIVSDNSDLHTNTYITSASGFPPIVCIERTGKVRPER